MPAVPTNCKIIVETKKVMQKDGSVLKTQVERCIPDTVANILTAHSIGGKTKLCLQLTALAKGINMHAVHDFNLKSGWLDGDTQISNKEESLDSSIRRTKRLVNEYAACNDWDHFVTITLCPELWDRNNPAGLQTYIKEQSRRWKEYGYAYLFVPEPHETSGAIHLHGLAKSIPEDQLIQYQKEDLKKAQPLPLAVVEQVKVGKEIYHCRVWDEHLGYNLIEPIRDLDRAASYITKYITKDLGQLDLKSRIWHSRGLRRAQKIAAYQVKEWDIDDTRKLMQSIASKTDKERPLYQETYQKIVFEDGVGKCLRAVTAYVNECDMPRENLIEHLDKTYKKIEEEEESDEQ